MKSLSKFEKDAVGKYPAYADTHYLDELRESDFRRLDEKGHVYLDYTGGNLYASRQIEEHAIMLQNEVLGNPHSFNPSSLKASKLVNETRDAILDFFNARKDYFLIFTPNASGALKIIGESYPFDEKSHFLLPFDNHNSVNGIREYAKNKGASYSYSPLRDDNLRFDEESLRHNLRSYSGKSNKLFAYPAQSNVSGVKHSLDWISAAHANGWDVLLDASAYVPTSKLDLKEINPDFVTMSFYKMFGYPTGLGALLVRKDTFGKLKKPWFAGGTVTLASAMADSFYLAEDHSKYEDGTINYLGIPALKIGIELLSEIGMSTISKRITILTDILLSELQKLTYPNGNPMVTIFGPKENKERGGTVIFNFLSDDGSLLPYMNVESEANKRNISIRTGCFCNPGIDEINNHIRSTELNSFFKLHSSGGIGDMMEHFQTMRGAIRVSVGYVTNLKDLHTFFQFAEDFCMSHHKESELI